MQTFLPYRSFSATAKVLDRQRLGKQRVETLQLLRAIHYGTGWRNHPATKMWEPFSQLLVHYGVTICDEWILRGYRDSCREKILGFYQPVQVDWPKWLDNPDLFSSHRGALRYKNPYHYDRHGWEEEPLTPNAKGSLPYHWPGEDEMVKVYSFNGESFDQVASDLNDWFGEPEITVDRQLPNEPYFVPTKLNLGREVPRATFLTKATETHP